MSLATPQSVGKLQSALGAKAKAEPKFRFYQLWDKVWRKDVLAFAYAKSRANKGKAGVDGQTFADIESYGAERWLGELAEGLRTKTYEPQAVRRVWIEKENGGRRPLGIPTIRDRVVQTALLLVLDPIFEGDLMPEQYAYREGRSALDAVKAVDQHVYRGLSDVVDADLKGYFDSIPHGELMTCVARRIVDREVLRVVKSYLEVAVEEEVESGRVVRTTANRNEGRGTPQGSPLSPFLSNLYMRRFVLGWKVQGHEGRLGAVIVNYADDFVICSKGNAQACLDAMRGMMSKLKLTVNESKTRTCAAKRESFEFLGYRFGPHYSWQKRRLYPGMSPSKRKVGTLCRKLSSATSKSATDASEAEKVEELNRILRGWRNYFRLGALAGAYDVAMKHARRRLGEWLRKKRGVLRGEASRHPKEYWHGTMNLIDLQKLRKAES